MLKHSVFVALLLLPTNCALFRPSEQTEAMVEASGTLVSLHRELYDAIVQILVLLEAKNPGSPEIGKIRVAIEVNKANTVNIQRDLVRLIKSSGFDRETEKELVGLVWTVVDKATTHGN